MVAFTIGKEKRMPIQGKKAPDPGPGNYDVKPDGGVVKQSAPQWRIGSETRDKGPGSKKAPIPGPGSYALPSLLATGPKWVMAERSSRRMNTSLGPGPGSYEFKETKMKIAYTMGSKKELQRAGESMNLTQPGPGSYTPRDSFYHPTGGRIGTERRIESGSRSNLPVPGPGRYDSMASLTANRSPRYGFGTQEKFFDNKQKEKVFSSSPGPGAYEARRIIGLEGSKYSMGDNKPSKPLHIDKVPGPGSYSFDFKPQSPQYRIGTSKRTDTETIKFAKNPAPGAYSPSNVTRQSHPNWKFGTESRKGLAKSPNPGPGSYEAPQKAVEGSKFSFGLKPQNKLKAVDPGPGQYNPTAEKLKNRAPAFMMGTGPKMGRLDRGTVAPGPGQYSPKSSDGSAKFGFGSQARDAKKCESTPGPGSYMIPVKFAENPEFVLRKSQELKFV